jgi:hypothetical protein
MRIHEDQYCTSERLRGPQRVEVGPLAVTFLQDDTRLLSTANKLVPYSHFLLDFLSNQAVRHMFIRVMGGDEQTFGEGIARELLDNLLDQEGLVQDEGSAVSGVLGPHFPDLQITYVRKRSEEPDLVGAIVSTGSSEILFTFQLERGALLSPTLADELRRSVRIKLR